MKKLKLLPILLLFLSGPLFAQEQYKDLIYVWDDFSKGLNTKLSEFSLPKNQATIAENVRYDKKLKALSKRAEVFSYGTMDTTEPGTSLHRLYLKDTTKVLIGTHGDEIEAGVDATGNFTAILDLTTGDYRWQWLTWHDVGIGCDGFNQPVKYDGSSVSATYLGSLLATVHTAGSGPASGSRSYKVSYYTSTYEVIYDVISNAITGTGKDILLSMIPIAPDTFGGEDVVGRRIYRNKLAAQTTWYELTNSPITNNTATTLTDTDTDAELSATEYPGGDATYTPPKGKFSVIHRNRLWFANDPNYPSRIYYSEDGSHDTFLDNAYFNIRPNDGDEITFAKNLGGVLTISKNNTIQFIDTYKGDSPTADWEISDPFSFTGCDAPYSVSNSPLGIIYLDWTGLYTFNGSSSQLISEAITPEILDISESDFANCWGIFHKNIYYLAYTAESTGASTNDRVLGLDILSNAYFIDLLSINAFCTFSSGDDWDVLYSVSSNNGTVNAHEETIHGVRHRRQSDFTGTFDDMRYIPTKWGGDINNVVLEIANITTIDDLTGIINDLTGDINREDTAGSYISQVLHTGATTFDRLYWHETIPAAGGDVLFYIRSDTTSDLCEAATWSSSYTDATGSDISGDSAYAYVQYKIELSTDDIDYTPNVKSIGGFAVKFTYDMEGITQETTIPLHWRGGWTDLGYPDMDKTLTSMTCYYGYKENVSGTINIKFENFEGDSDTFEINTLEDPGMYSDKFTNFAFVGDLFLLDITESSLNDVHIDKIIINFDVEPTP